MKTTTQLIIAGVMVLAVASCDNDDNATQLDRLLISLELEPDAALDVQCPPGPIESRTALFAGIFVNQMPVKPDSPGFPDDFCPPETAFFNTAEGRGNSNILGQFIWHERYCAGTLKGLIAEGYFQAENGDRLNWDAQIHRDEDSPPHPEMTFGGEFKFTGGTGALSGIKGEAFVAAKQLGDAKSINRPGSTAATLCGWTADVSKSQH
jgi:hypothetical protein